MVACDADDKWQQRQPSELGKNKSFILLVFGEMLNLKLFYNNIMIKLNIIWTDGLKIFKYA